MNFSEGGWNKGENAVFLLRSLFEKYGYSQFKMNKFEEYDLYVRNKDFLISDGVITFTDTNGKLLALKPDVTLSIIKNAIFQEGMVDKVYYDENVYRVSSGTQSFKEIRQVGIECIGSVDDYCIFEVLQLAALSLKALSSDVILDISHFGLITHLLASLGLSGREKKRVLTAMSEKNLHELEVICREIGVGENEEKILLGLASTYGAPAKVLPKLKNLLKNTDFVCELDLLDRICIQLTEAGLGEILNIDFSVVNHTDYYNGIVFKGFIKSIPTSVLSGGQYDGLMKKMGSGAGAIGFALYMDLLSDLFLDSRKFDVEAVLLYDDMACLNRVRDAVEQLAQNYKSVVAQRKIPEKMRYRALFKLTETGVTELEGNA